MNYTYNLISQTENFKNGSSKLLNVNGSVTPQVFEYAPDANKLVAITELTCILKDEGNTQLTNFGALGPLTNGLLVEAEINDTTITIMNLKDNADLATRFTFSQFGNGAVISVLGLGTAQGFGNSNNIFIGSMQLPEPILLRGDLGDSIKIIVRDNLQAIDVLQMGLHFVNLFE